MQLLVLMKGHPGCGKSSVARCLSELTSIALIDKDDARDCLTSLKSLADKVHSTASKPIKLIPGHSAEPFHG